MGVSVFVLTLFIGLYTGGFFEHYVFKFYFAESFSRGEAQSLIGKKVQDICLSGDENSARYGVVSGYSNEDFGDIYVEIPWRGYYSARMSKGYFKKCVRVVDSE